MPNKLSQFWQELKRRKVIHVIIVYATTAFIIIELITNVSEPLRLPEWTPTLVILILVIGFPLAVIFSWIFDVSSDGVQKTKPLKDVEKGEDSAVSSSWRIATYVSVVIIIGFIVFNILSRSRHSDDLFSLEKSIAVLPFENMSDSEEYSHLGDAMTDEIILELQKINELDRVLSRTSTIQFKTNRSSIPEIADKLGVNYIIEGSIQRHKEDVSIRVQVIRAKHEDLVWGDEYDGKWEDIFSIQDEIAFRVANELKTVLSPEEIRKIEKNPTESLKAYNLYLIGRYYWNNRTEEGFLTGIEYFRQAIEEDPAYALAYAGIADCYNLLGWHDLFPSEVVYPKAKSAAETALLMDENLSQAHASLAYVKMLYDWNWQAAEKGFKRALEINPNYAEAHQWYSEYLAYMERHDESIAEAKRAQDLDPLSLSISHNLGLVFYEAHKFDLAIEEYQNTLQMDSSFIVAYNYLGLAYAGKKMYNEALINIQKAVELDAKQSPLYIGTLGFIYVSMGNGDEAREVLEHLLELSRIRYIAPVSLAILYGALGQKDQAFEWMEKGYEVRDDYLMVLKVDPRLDSLRSDPRYQDLLDRMNFPDK
jgi:TolB-like protein/Tfp pilus assembly protein PilF